MTDIWAIRRAKWGQAGLSPKGAKSISTGLMDRNLARTHCKRGHEFAVHAVMKKGVRVCIPCRRIRKNMASRKKAGFLVAGLQNVGLGQNDGFGSFSLKMAWIRRREKYGPTGLTPAMTAKLSVACKKRLKEHGHPAAKKTHCIHGHRYTPGTMKRNSKGRRECLVCSGRPLFVTDADGIRTYVRVHDKWYRAAARLLRIAMMKAHPDRHPHRKMTGMNFDIRRKKWLAFIKRETHWYTKFGLKPPTVDYNVSMVKRALRIWRRVERVRSQWSEAAG